MKIKSKTDILVLRGKDNTSFIKGVHMIRNQNGRSMVEMLGVLAISELFRLAALPVIRWL